MVRYAMILAIALSLGCRTAAPRSLAAPSPRSSISMSVTSPGTQVSAGSDTELRGVVVKIDATGPWQLLVHATTPDSAVSACLREVRGPARSLGRDFRLVRQGTPVASGAAGREIELVFDYRLPAGTSATVITYVIVPE